MGLTIIDSLDTMLIMGLHDEYKRGVDYLRQHLDWDKVRFPAYPLPPSLSFTLLFPFSL